jgi:hypothetical protein
MMLLYSPLRKEALAGIPSTSYSYGFGSNITNYVGAGRTYVTLAEIAIGDGNEYLRVSLNVNVTCSYVSGYAEGVADYLYVYGVTGGGSTVYIGVIAGSFWRTPQGTFSGTVTIPSGYTRLRFVAYWDSQYLAGSYCPSYWDLSGSVAYVGGYASTTGEVQQATTAAQQANTSAQQAKTSADQAKASADAALSAVNNANGNTITAVRDANGTVLAEARNANAKLDTLQTAITNIQNGMSADTIPPAVKIRTVSGAMATSGSSIVAVLEISDNTNSSFTYSLDNVVYQAVPANRMVSLPVSSPGANCIPVWVKDQAGNMGMGSITVRKL